MVLLLFYYYCCRNTLWQLKDNAQIITVTPQIVATTRAIIAIVTLLKITAATLRVLSPHHTTCTNYRYNPQQCGDNLMIARILVTNLLHLWFLE